MAPSQTQHVETPELLPGRLTLPCIGRQGLGLRVMGPGSSSTLHIGYIKLAAKLLQVAGGEFVPKLLTTASSSRP